MNSSANDSVIQKLSKYFVIAEVNNQDCPYRIEDFAIDNPEFQDKVLRKLPRSCRLSDIYLNEVGTPQYQFYNSGAGPVPGAYKLEWRTIKGWDFGRFPSWCERAAK